MNKFEVLKSLEKSSKVEICYCDFIADKDYFPEDNTRIRILKSRVNGKYYYHKMHDGEVIECFEIAYGWSPFGKFDVFEYTPDNIHRYNIETRDLKRKNCHPIDDYEVEIVENMQCEYKGITVKYLNENEIQFNGKSVKVECDNEYTYKMLQTKIKAIKGAKGLFIFLDGIAEESKESYPLFSTVYDRIKEKYLV